MRQLMILTMAAVLTVSTVQAKPPPVYRYVLAPATYAYNFNPMADSYTIDFTMASGRVYTYDLTTARFVTGHDENGVSYSVMRIKKNENETPTYVFMNINPGDLRRGEFFDFDPPETVNGLDLTTFRITKVYEPGVADMKCRDPR